MITCTCILHTELFKGYCSLSLSLSLLLRREDTPLTPLFESVISAVSPPTILLQALSYHCRGRDWTIKVSKRNFAKRNKTAFGPRGQTETSLKIEDLRSIFLNKLKIVGNTNKIEKIKTKRLWGPLEIHRPL